MVTVSTEFSAANSALSVRHKEEGICVVLHDVPPGRQSTGHKNRTTRQKNSGRGSVFNFFILRKSFMSTDKCNKNDSNDKDNKSKLV